MLFRFHRWTTVVFFKVLWYLLGHESWLSIIYLLDEVLRTNTWSWWQSVGSPKLIHMLVRISIAYSKKPAGCWMSRFQQYHFGCGTQEKNPSRLWWNTQCFGWLIGWIVFSDMEVTCFLVGPPWMNRSLFVKIYVNSGRIIVWWIPIFLFIAPSPNVSGILVSQSQFTVTREGERQKHQSWLWLPKWSCHWRGPNPTWKGSSEVFSTSFCFTCNWYIYVFDFDKSIWGKIFICFQELMFLYCICKLWFCPIAIRMLIWDPFWTSPIPSDG